MIRLLPFPMVLVALSAMAAEVPADNPPSPGNPPASLAACRAILLPPGTRETIQANINVGTRIQFPGTVKTFQVDTPGLWDASAKDDSVFIRPKTTDANAAATGVSVFLANGRKYDFVAQRRAARCLLAKQR